MKINDNEQLYFRILSRDVQRLVIALLAKIAVIMSVDVTVHQREFLS